MEFKPKKTLVIPHYRLLANIGIATLISWGALALVITEMDPYESAQLALPFFFISNILALTGTFTFILFFIKKWRAEGGVYVKHVFISLRQGLLLSLCTNLSLLLLLFGMLRVWNGLLITALMLLLEFYMSAKDELH